MYVISTALNPATALLVALLALSLLLVVSARTVAELRRYRESTI